MENEIFELSAEAEWTSPDGSVSIAVVSHYDKDGNEKFSICLASDNGDATVIAEFAPNVSYEVIVSFIVFLQITEPTISQRLKMMLDGSLTEGK